MAHDGFDDSYEFDAGDSVSNSPLLKESGYWHMVVTQVDFPATNKDGSLDSENLMRIHFEVRTPSASGKMFSAGFKDPRLPSLSASQREFHTKKRDRLFIATNLMQESDVGKTGLKISMQAMRGEQLVIKTEYGPSFKDPNQFYCNISFTDIYHVDDPAVKNVAFNAEDLRVIHASKRKIGQRAAAPLPAPKRLSADDVL